MVSLFCLFALFYKRSYSKKNRAGKKSEKKSEDDQCHKAMGEISEAAKEAAGHAVKDASKLVGAVKRTNGKSNRVGAM